MQKDQKQEHSQSQSQSQTQSQTKHSSHEPDDRPHAAEPRDQQWQKHDVITEITEKLVEEEGYDPQVLEAEVVDVAQPDDEEFVEEEPNRQVILMYL